MLAENNGPAGRLREHCSVGVRVWERMVSHATCSRRHGQSHVNRKQFQEKNHPFRSLQATCPQTFARTTPGGMRLTPHFERDRFFHCLMLEAGSLSGRSPLRFPVGVVCSARHWNLWLGDHSQCMPGSEFHVGNRSSFPLTCTVTRPDS